MIERLEDFLEWGGIQKEIILLIISFGSLFVSLFNVFSIPFETSWIAILLCGTPIILEAIIGLVKEFDIKADVLVSLALIASIIIGEYFAAGEVACIMQLGALLEDLTVAKARSGIEKLVLMTPQQARLVLNGEEKMISSKDVCIGNRIRVLPGEMIPVDGKIVDGQTSVNQAVMTGESMPVDKTIGDDVSSGTVNQFGTFDMIATKVGEDSAIQRMIRLVQSVDAGKAKIVGIADKWATWIVVIALASALMTWFLTGEMMRSVTILVVFCPCALVLATPTAIMAASGNATEHGFLVREGDALERLSKVTQVAFDKTGTLTYGELEVVKVKALTQDYSEKVLHEMIASAESFSEHPLGKAIVKSYKTLYGELVSHCSQFQLLIGQGILALVNEKEVLAGNQSLLKNYGISINQSVIDEVNIYRNKGNTAIYIVVDKVLVGYLILADMIRKESKSLIKALHQLDIQTILLTGDHEQVANRIAEELSINEIHANCMPEDKMKWIDNYQKLNQKICMIGDGINDAPSLKKAFVGIAMGGVGSDIAVDASDIVLVNDEINELSHLLSLSQKMMRTIRFNLSFSMILNFIAIILAMTGILNPIVGALVHNAGSVFVIIHSAFLLKWKKI